MTRTRKKEITIMNCNRKLSRRELLRWSTGSLLAAGFWPGVLAARGEDKSDSFHFLVVNDVHYLNARCGPWLEGAIRQMKEHKETIDFCLLVGDLGEHGRIDQISAVRDIFKKLPMPVHVVVGNHDYVTETNRRAFEMLFPDRINYHFEHRGWQFVGLDTTEGQQARGTSVQPHTFRWLDDTLPKLDKKRPTVVFTHFPMGILVPGRPKNASELLGRFKELNLQAVYNGHLHGFTERHMGKTVLTTNKCCSFSRQNHDGTKEKGYFLCQAKDGAIERTFVEVKPA